MVWCPDVLEGSRLNGGSLGTSSQMTPVHDQRDVPIEYRGTAIADLFAYHNLRAPHPREIVSFASSSHAHAISNGPPC